jgi:hypothetical protein
MPTTHRNRRLQGSEESARSPIVVASSTLGGVTNQGATHRRKERTKDVVHYLHAADRLAWCAGG